MLFLHHHFAKIVALLLLLIPEISFANVNEVYESRILEANQEIMSTNFRLKIYAITSVVFVCLLVVYLSLAQTRLKKRFAAINELLERELDARCIENYNLKHKCNVLKHLYLRLSDRIKHILNRLVELRKDVSRQEETTSEIARVIDFTGKVSTSFNKSVRLFNSLE